MGMLGKIFHTKLNDLTALFITERDSSRSKKLEKIKIKGGIEKILFIFEGSSDFYYYWNLILLK